uniref:Uncharacterized protein n=1 Tax=Arundo donax TaxID=35708 RepID=A0A0A8ZTG9_ARUDO
MPLRQGKANLHQYIKTGVTLEVGFLS